MKPNDATTDMLAGETQVERRRRLKKEWHRRWYQANPEKAKAKADRWRAKNPEKYREMMRRYDAKNKDKRNLWAREWAKANPEKIKKLNQKRYTTKEGRIRMLIENSKFRAKKKGTPWNLTFEYLLSIAVDVCPLSGEALAWNQAGHGHNPIIKAFSPSLDQIRPGEGYVEGNVWFVSWVANQVKADFGPEFSDIIIRIGENYKKLVPVKF